jgi:hypothetical protein
MTTSTTGFWCEATNAATRPDVLDDMLAFNSENGRPQVWMIVLENDSQGVWGAGPAVFLRAALAGDQGYVNWADLATLREIPDLVALLRPALTSTGEVLPTVCCRCPG